MYVNANVQDIKNCYSDPPLVNNVVTANSADSPGPTLVYATIVIWYWVHDLRLAKENMVAVEKSETTESLFSMAITYNYYKTIMRQQNKYT